MKSSKHDRPDWTFFSNHAHVLFAIALEPGIVLRDVATRVGITERSVQGIVKDLESDRILVRYREGRNNRYQVKWQTRLRHPIESHLRLKDLFDLLQNR